MDIFKINQLIIRIGGTTLELADVILDEDNDIRRLIGLATGSHISFDLELPLTRETAELYGVLKLMGSETGLTVEQLKRLEALNKNIDGLELSIRNRNALAAAGFKKVWQLCELTEARYLKDIRGGRKALNELKEVLAEMNLDMNMDLTIFRSRLERPT